MVFSKILQQIFHSCHSIIFLFLRNKLLYLSYQGDENEGFFLIYCFTQTTSSSQNTLLPVLMLGYFLSLSSQFKNILNRPSWTFNMNFKKHSSSPNLIKANDELNLIKLFVLIWLSAASDTDCSFLLKPFKALFSSYYILLTH